MDAISFYFGIGIALFIALLAWGDLIRKPKADVTELEKNYITNLGKKKKKILPLLRPPSKYTFTQQMDSIIDLWQDKKMKKQDLELSKQIKMLHKKSKSLEHFYIFRYLAVILLTIFAFIFGIVSVFNGNEIINKTITVGKEIMSVPLITFASIDLKWNHIYIGIILLAIAIVIINMVWSFFKEQSFIISLYDSFDKIEGK